MDDLIRLLFNPEFMAEHVPTLLAEGLVNTIILSFSAFFYGLVVGLILALMSVSTHTWVRWPAKVYVDIFRGLPAILVIFYVGFGFPLLNVPFPTSRQGYAILALTLIGSAYICEILRAGIQSVEKGQMEAARSIGMRYLPAMWIVVIPQGWRRVLPPLTNEFIALIKDSSLVFMIGMSIGDRELFRIGQQAAQREVNLSALTAAGLLYLVITVPLTHVVNWWDKRLREGKPVEPSEELPAAVEESMRRGGH
jgi:His/Glu/Gln/Arg/opine family amino acid ABC transporter permease subunit